MAARYEDQLKAEIKTWCIPDEQERAEKYQRERIRHSKLIKDLLLDKLDTHRMDILEVGGGPEPVSDLLQFRSRLVADPCSDQYKEFFPCPDHRAVKVEDLMGGGWVSLAICTNALDHVENPDLALEKMDDALVPGGYMAIMCAENNALTNPHPCHVHNLTARWVHERLDENYETVWELTYAKDNYRYGWVEYEERRGQPAFALLMRKCVGY